MNQETQPTTASAVTFENNVFNQEPVVQSTTKEKSHKSTNGFLTHTWQDDSRGRPNHARVAVVNDLLNRRGFTTWFDSKKMTGQIREKMKEGVDHTDCVIVFVTAA